MKRTCYVHLQAVDIHDATLVQGYIALKVDTDTLLPQSTLSILGVSDCHRCNSSLGDYKCWYNPRATSLIGLEESDVRKAR